MSRNTAVAFDENAIGANLILSNSDSILMTSVATDAHRMARSLYPQNSLKSSVEFYIYSPDGTRPTLAGTPPPIMLGVVTAQAGFDKFVGEDANGWGINPNDGKIYHNNAVVTTLAGFTLSTYVTVVLDPLIGALCFMANGKVLGVINIGAGTYYYAATVSGAPGDFAVWANAGQTPVRYPCGTNGWTHPQTGINPLFVATEPFISDPADAIANRKYYGDVDRATSAINIPRRVKVWPWGASADEAFGFASGSLLQIPLNDPYHLHDDLLTLTVRDQLIQIQRTAQYGTVNAAENVFQGVIDRCIPVTQQKKMLYCGDKSLLLQQQPQRPLFPPDADASVAFKPRPLTLGIRRTLRAPLFDSTNFYYAAADAPIAAVGKLRMSGKELGLGIDVAALPDATGFDFTAAQTGTFTVEVSDYGGTFSTSTADVLAGSGVFGSVVAQGNGQPTGWTGNGGYGSQDAANTLFQVNGASPNKFVRQAQKADAVYTLKHNTYTLAAGASYSIKVVFLQVPWFGEGVDVNGLPLQILPATLVIGGHPNSDSNGMIQFFNFAQTRLTAAGTYTLTVTNTQSVALPLVLGLLCNSMLQGWGGHFSFFDFNDVEMVALPALLQNVSLPGPPLDYILQQLYIKRGPLTLSDYDPSGAQAIDAATGYTYGVHATPSETFTVADLAKPLLDSCCGDDFPARSGQISTFRLIAPESATTIAGALTVTDQASELLSYDDLAEGLTTSAVGCENCDPLNESDFANVSLNDVPTSVRKILQEKYQWTAVSTAIVASVYNHARGANPLQTKFDRIADGQAEITRVNALYSSPRNFYAGTFFAPLGRVFEIGQVWNVTDPNLAGLKTGAQLLLVGVDDQPSEGTAKLVFWGF